MPAFRKDELTAALAGYTAVVEVCTRTGDWAPFADLFTEDCVYTEHAYGVFEGREAVRTWIVDVMRPFPHMRFPTDWVAYDEENGALVIGIRNVLDHPAGEPVEFGFPNWTRLVYAGDGLFSSEEDIYNPMRDAPRVVGAWIKAGGRPATEVPSITHG